MMASTLQLVDRTGVLDVEGLQNFIQRCGLEECGVCYAVVAIMGPQSSGKSTLLNHLFHTTFPEMDAMNGRSQTTQGVWLARAEGMTPCTLVVDLEGTDGAERGEDDTLFERQSSLFALALSDVVLINMWCKDIGLNRAANRPLLKIVFQVMMRMFTPRKTTLLFVIRDTSKTPPHILESDLRNDIQKIWNESVSNQPTNRPHPTLSEFFNVEVTCLESFEGDSEVFKEQVAALRGRFENSISPEGLAGDRSVAVPGSGFLVSTENIWRMIKENKDLDLPKHKVMVSVVRCEQIAEEKLQKLASDETWRVVKEQAKVNVVGGFGNIVNGLIKTILDEYNAETDFFDEDVRASKQKSLTSGILNEVDPSYKAVIGHIRANVFRNFKRRFDSDIPELTRGEDFKTCWRLCSRESLEEFDFGFNDAKVAYSERDFSNAKGKLSNDIELHAGAKQREKIEELKSVIFNNLGDALRSPTASHFEHATTPGTTWSNIRSLLKNEVEKAISELDSTIDGFEAPTEERDTMREELVIYGRAIVEGEAKLEVANRLPEQMVERFKFALRNDANNNPRQWATEKHDIEAVTQQGKASCAKYLSVMAAIRLDEGIGNGEENASSNEGSPEDIRASSRYEDVDEIESLLDPLVIGRESMFRYLGRVLSLVSDNSPDEKRKEALQNLSVTTWPFGVPPGCTLITPMECIDIWKQFESRIEAPIRQAKEGQASAIRKVRKLVAWSAVAGAGSRILIA